MSNDSRSTLINCEVGKLSWCSGIAGECSLRACEREGS